MKKSTWDAVNQIVCVGDEIAYLRNTPNENSIEIVCSIRTVGNASGGAITKTWDEVQFSANKTWVKASKIVRLNRF